MQQQVKMKYDADDDDGMKQRIYSRVAKPIKMMYFKLTCKVDSMGQK